MKLSKGALPVPYIVALIIAIIVIAVLVYWFFILGGQGGDEALKTKCRGNILLYCSQWAACGYADTCRPKNSAGSNDFYTIYPECEKFRNQPGGLPAGVEREQCTPG